MSTPDNDPEEVSADLLNF